MKISFPEDAIELNSVLMAKVPNFKINHQVLQLEFSSISINLKREETRLSANQEVYFQLKIWRISSL